MIVVFDTNIWLSELGLRSTAGSAVSADAIREKHRRLLAMFGTLKEIVLPGAAP